MNRLTIIGNLTKAPDIRITSTGVNVCTFTVAVNRSKASNGQQEADFFRVTTWRGLADVCHQYLAKSSKVAVTGSVSVTAYTSNEGDARASMEVTADEVEFLSPVNR